MCAMHHSIAWAYRMNSGGMYNPSGRFVKFAFKGCSDIIGQTIDGRFFAWETKRPDQKPTDNQHAFLEAVAEARGIAGWSDNVQSLCYCLESLELYVYPKLGIFENIKSP